QYHSSYINVGFTWTGEQDEPRPQCVLCYAVLANKSLKPANLWRHLETNHAAFKDKPPEFFQHKLNELKQGKVTMFAHAK
ncbi:hypothetical protein KIL84_019594, partial [Mauremys mutica]